MSVSRSKRTGSTSDPWAAVGANGNGTVRGYEACQTWASQAGFFYRRPAQESVLAWERELLASLDGAMVAVDDKGIIFVANQRACDLLSQEHLAGRPLTDIIPPRLQPAHRAGFARYVHTGESRLHGRTVRVPALRGDGTEVELDLTIRVFQRPDGSRLALAALASAPAGVAPPHLLAIQSEFELASYEVV